MVEESLLQRFHQLKMTSKKKIQLSSATSIQMKSISLQFYQSSIQGFFYNTLHKAGGSYFGGKLNYDSTCPSFYIELLTCN